MDKHNNKANKVKKAIIWGFCFWHIQSNRYHKSYKVKKLQTAFCSNFTKILLVCHIEVSSCHTKYSLKSKAISTKMTDNKANKLILFGSFVFETYKQIDYKSLRSKKLAPTCLL